MENLGVSEKELDKSLEEYEFHIENQSQRGLAVKLLYYEDVIESVLTDLFVHKLSD